MQENYCNDCEVEHCSVCNHCAECICMDLAINKFIISNGLDPLAWDGCLQQVPMSNHPQDCFYMRLGLDKCYVSRNNQEIFIEWAKLTEKLFNLRR